MYIKMFLFVEATGGNEVKGKVLFSGLALSNLTFKGPCIVIHSYNKSQRDALFLKFILVKKSTCFGQIYRPSSGVSALYTQKHVLVFDMRVMLTVC